MYDVIFSVLGLFTLVQEYSEKGLTYEFDCWGNFPFSSSKAGMLPHAPDICWHLHLQKLPATSPRDLPVGHYYLWAQSWRKLTSLASEKYSRGRQG